MHIFAYVLCLLSCLQVCKHFSVKLEINFCFVLWVIRIWLFYDENSILPVFFIWIYFYKLNTSLTWVVTYLTYCTSKSSRHKCLLLNIWMFKKMRLWLIHRTKTLNHQRNKHLCRLIFANQKTHPCKLTLENGVQNFCLSSFIYEKVWKTHSWRNGQNFLSEWRQRKINLVAASDTRELRWKCLTTKYFKKPLNLPVLKDFLKTVSISDWMLNLTLKESNSDLSQGQITHQRCFYNRMGMRYKFLELYSRDVQKWLEKCRNTYLWF